VPGAGIEPAWPCGRGILSPLRIPVSPSGPARRMPDDAVRDQRFGALREKDGGLGRNRTGVRGFAGRCMTTLPPGRWDGELNASSSKNKTSADRGSCAGSAMARGLAGSSRRRCWQPDRGELTGAGNETRTRDLNLGKVALYQLSYSRVGGAYYGMPQKSQPVLFESHGNRTFARDCAAAFGLKSCRCRHRA
jgi:hypothetical protein